MGIAYRLLGSVSEAEDAVQDTAYKWFAADGELPDKPVAWLTAVCTNRCLDILKSAQRTKVDYVGPWLPEQVEMATTEDAEHKLEIASSLSTAFLLLLERLTPKERAAYLLHDIFSISHLEISEMLGVSDTNSRKLASRARRLVAEEKVRFVPSQDQQTKLLDEFQNALQTGDIARFAAALNKDVDLRADSGGKVTAIRRVLEGAGVVQNFIAAVLSPAWGRFTYETRMVNGLLSLIVWNENEPHALVAFSYGTDALVKSIFILRHPEKLKQTLGIRAHAGPDGSMYFH